MVCLSYMYCIVLECTPVVVYVGCVNKVYKIMHKIMASLNNYYGLCGCTLY